MKYLYIFFLCTVISCASIVTPSGGEKDTQAPTLKRTIPLNNSINIIDKKIEFVFDEYIQIKNKNGICINPRPITNPKIIVKAKKLIIQFDTLEADRTYSISFINAIADINENNVLNSLNYTFSTGNKIDNHIICGYTKNIDERIDNKNLIAVMYDGEMDDSTLYNKNPNYLTNVDLTGYYCFRGLENKKYNIFIINDINKNDLIDNGEDFGFINTSVNSGNQDSIHLDRIYIYHDKTFEKASVNTFYSNEYGVFNFIITPKNCYKKLIDNNLFTEESYTTIFEGETADTITWYSPMADLQEGHFDLYLNDVYNPDLTTVHMNNTYFLRKLNIHDININGKNLDLFDTVKVRFNNPIFNLNKDYIDLYIDSIKQKNIDLYYFLDMEKTKLRIFNEWLPTTKYQFVFNKGALVDIFNQKNDSFSIMFKTEKESIYGSINFNFNLDTNIMYTVQLKNSKNIPVKTFYINSNKSVQIKYLLPDIYYLEIIEDINMNQTWDEGYYFKKRLPERTIQLEGRYSIKAGIDIENIKVNLNKLSF